MVLPSRRWSHASHLRHGQHDREHAESDYDNEPYGSSSAAVSQREHGCHDGEFPGQAEDDDVADDAEKLEAALRGSQSMNFIFCTCVDVLSALGAFPVGAYHVDRVPHCKYCSRRVRHPYRWSGVLS
jgi:hypothetical protein